MSTPTVHEMVRANCEQLYSSMPMQMLLAYCILETMATARELSDSFSPLVDSDAFQALQSELVKIASLATAAASILAPPVSLDRNEEYDGSGELDG